MTAVDGRSTTWSDASLAAVLFAVDPAGLGGVTVRSPPGPPRTRWLADIEALLPVRTPLGRIPLRIPDDRLLGGMDLSASLAAGRPILERGVLAACDGGVAILAMAERLEDGVGARLAAVLDSGEVVIERDGLGTRLPARLGLIALDEGLEADERPPIALLERLAFRIDLTDLGSRDLPDRSHDRSRVGDARRRLSQVAQGSKAIIEGLCMASEAFGILGVRPVILALRAARAHAALNGRTDVCGDDAAAAARLVFAPRALTAPANPAESSDAVDPRPETTGDRDLAPPETERPNLVADAEMLIAAIQGALPERLLEQVAHKAQRTGRSTGGQGSGALVVSAKRGRPVGSRHGVLRAGDRLNLPETLRAATPWQKLRTGGPSGPRIQVRQEDFRIRRFAQRRESTTIFVVDASGSAAFQRLAEAKGAVELLLAKAYVSRARVALIAFRNVGAEVLLAPTRSLTRAKRSLADLPGGGGTPLASGLDAALRLSEAEKAKERTPLIVILTDGRTNIGRNGSPGRAAAENDAMAASRAVGAAAVGAVFIDTSPRVTPNGDRFARAMGAVYAPLPYAEAGAVSELVAGLGKGRGRR